MVRTRAILGAAVRIGITFTAAAATTASLRRARFLCEPLLLYFAAVVASATILDGTDGFVVVVGTSIGPLLYYYSAAYPPGATMDLLAIMVFATIAALNVEAFCPRCER